MSSTNPDSRVGVEVKKVVRTGFLSLWDKDLTIGGGSVPRKGLRLLLGPDRRTETNVCPSLGIVHVTLGKRLCFSMSVRVL